MAMVTARTSLAASSSRLVVQAQPYFFGELPGPRLVAIADDRQLGRRVVRQREGVIAAPDAGAHDADPDSRVRLRHDLDFWQAARGYHDDLRADNVESTTTARTCGVLQ